MRKLGKQPRQDAGPPALDRIRDVTFRPRWRGYNFAEVDQFIDDVADAVDALQAELRAAAVRSAKTEELEAQLQQILGTVESLQSQLAPGLSGWQRRSEMTASVQARVRRQAERTDAIQTPADVPLAELAETLGDKHRAADTAVEVTARHRPDAAVEVGEVGEVEAEPVVEPAAEIGTVVEVDTVVSDEPSPPTEPPRPRVSVWEPSVSSF